MNVQRADTIQPISPGNLTFNEVEINATPPTAGQTLIATSSTSASWQNQTFGAPVDASYLVLALSPELTQERQVVFTGEFDVVDNGGGSTYNVSLSLQAVAGTVGNISTITINNTSNTAKGRLVVDNGSLIRFGFPYIYVRARGLINFGPVPPGSGDTIDGVLLNPGDSYLLVSQSSIPFNGVYQIPGGGGPGVIQNTPSGYSVYVREGDEGARSIYSFQGGNLIYAYATDAQVRGINITNINDFFSPTIGTEPTNHYIGAGTYPVSSTFQFTVITVDWEGKSADSTIFSNTGAINSLDIQADDCVVKHLQFTGDNSNPDVHLVLLSSGTQANFLESVIFDGRTAINCQTDNVFIQNCSFRPGATVSVPILDFGNATAISSINVISCDFGTGTGTNFVHIGLSSTGDVNVLNIANCYFQGGNIFLENAGALGIQSVVRDNIFDPFGSASTSALEIQSQQHQVCNNIFDGGSVASVQGLNISGTGATEILNMVNKNRFINYNNGSIINVVGDYCIVVNDNDFDNTGTQPFISMTSANTLYNLIAGNTGESTVNPIINITGSFPELSVQNNNFLQILLNPANISGYGQRVLVDKDNVGFNASTLSDIELNSINHIIFIEVNSDTIGGPSVFDLTYTGIGLNNIEFVAVGSYAWLIWEGNAWRVLGNNNVVIT